MISRRQLPLLALPFSIACTPMINVEVLQPGLVTMPAEIKTIAVIDRSGAKNVGEGILSTLEGALTGEAIMADREGAHKAIEGLVSTMSQGPRFEVIQPGLNASQADSSIWADEMTWERSTRICEKYKCDAIVALESFDSDSSVNATSAVDSTGKTTWTAERNSSVLTAWRVYYPKQKTMLDDVRDRSMGRTWQQTADLRKTAEGALPAQYDTIMTLGYVAGDDYARRISPNYIIVARSYYGSGDPALKEGKNHVKAVDFEGAQEIWAKLATQSSDPKVRGKAEYDLALYYETVGELETALDWAKKGAVDLHNGRSRRYAAILSQRIADQKLLEEQMKAPAPPAPRPSRAQDGAPRSTGSSSGGGHTRPQ